MKHHQIFILILDNVPMILTFYFTFLRHVCPNYPHTGLATATAPSGHQMAIVVSQTIYFPQCGCRHASMNPVATTKTFSGNFINSGHRKLIQLPNQWGKIFSCIHHPKLNSHSGLWGGLSKGTVLPMQAWWQSYSTSDTTIKRVCGKIDHMNH